MSGPNPENKGDPTSGLGKLQDANTQIKIGLKKTPETYKEYIVFTDLVRVLEHVNKHMSENIGRRISILPKDWKEGLWAFGGLLATAVLVSLVSEWFKRLIWNT
ncbi:MAG: hypothetical protein MPJ06_08640 [Nitrosopumilus sp.]|nr:hypothetical protein [Nitrosopumilus sp.]MDA7944047.1 hypothetical protein [Nitrosopumilus sp.]MDA7999426.1 hypothetical protein [Nitrosopumilus sp.]